MNGTDKPAHHALECMQEEYLEIAETAHRDTSAQSDLAAAQLAPALLLCHPHNAERAFDKTLFHLDEAWRKAVTDDLRPEISQTADRIVFDAACLIESRIAYLRVQEPLVGPQAVSNFIGRICNESRHTAPARNQRDSAIIFSYVFQQLHKKIPAAGRSELVEMCLSYYLKYHSRDDEEQYLYERLLSLLEEYVNARLFDPNFQLVTGVFQHSEDDIYESYRHFYEPKGRRVAVWVTICGLASIAAFAVTWQLITLRVGLVTGVVTFSILSFVPFCVAKIDHWFRCRTIWRKLSRIGTVLCG